MTRTYIETYYAIPKLITRSKQKKHPKNCISQEKHKRDQINQPILPPLALKSNYCSLKGVPPADKNGDIGTSDKVGQDKSVGTN